MAKKEISIAEKLRTLYELQQLDSQIDQIKVLKGELPMEVSDLEDEIVGISTRIENLSTGLKDIDTDIAKHNHNIKDAETLILRYNKQLDTVKNNREYEALTKEIELQKLEIQLSEKKIRDAKGGIHGKTDALEIAQKKFDAKQKELDNKKVELAKIIEKTEKEEDKLAKLSDKARKKVEDRLLFAYDRVRRSYRNGLAVVTVERDSCGGCFNQIPPQIQVDISLSKKIIVCENCGRILIDSNALHDQEVVEKATIVEDVEE